MAMQTLGSLLSANAGRLGSHDAVVHGDRRVSFAELEELADDLAGRLAALGLEPGDRLLLPLPNRLELVLAILAAGKLGVAAVLLDPQSREHELTFALGDCRPAAILAEPAGAQRCLELLSSLGTQVPVISTGDAPAGAVPLSDLPAGAGERGLDRATPDMTLVCQYSSGSTGRSKRVERTHRQCVSEARLVRETLEMSPDDRLLCAVPLIHAYGLGDCFTASLESGATLVLQPEPQPFALKRDRTLELIERERITLFPAVPFMVDLLASATRDADLSSLRLLFTAGAALPLEVLEAFDSRYGVPPRQLYGCTECPSIAANLDEDPRESAASVGRPMRHVELRIESEEGGEAGEGAVGEVGVRSPAAATGYGGARDGDGRTFRDGWVFPGDLGYVDDEGRLTLVGRTKLFIEALGKKVDPVEVEEVLAVHPAVREAVVVGVRQPDGAEVVKATVVADGPCTERDLIRHCKERLASFKVPQTVEFRDAIPRSPLGKILRKELV
jgi:long-chain acyl-CoA synthetase